MRKPNNANERAWINEHHAVLSECIDAAAKAFPLYANGIHNSNLGMTLCVGMNGRLTASMGRASLKAGLYRVEYSAKLFPLATPENRRNTMVHEICHILGHIVGGKMAHDRVWKILMVACGESPQRCYTASERNFGENADVVRAASKARRKGRQGQRSQAKCGCWMGPVQRRRLLAGTHTYRCRHGKLTKEMI